VKRILLSVAVVVMLAVAPSAAAADSVAGTAALCGGLFGSTFGQPSSEPLAPCQWDMSLIGAWAARAWPSATGDGVSVGVIDTGIFSSTPTAVPQD